MLFTCPHCRQNVEAGPELAGLTVNCPHNNCRKQFLVPADSFAAKSLQGAPDGLGFDQERFRQLGRDSGADSQRMEMKLSQMSGSPPMDPAMAWAGLAATESGQLTKRLQKQASDFTEFAFLMARDTICPPQYYAAFWQMLRSGRGAT